MLADPMTPDTLVADAPASNSPPARDAARPLALEMRGIDKSFPGVHALREVDLTLAQGEILGLVGENGAGKSTLIKILSGAYASDRGDITVLGERVDGTSPHVMLDHGVAVIYQEPSLAAHLTVAENVFMGRLPRGPLGTVDWARADRELRSVADELELDLRPRDRVGRLSVARRQMVEIARALSRDARIIVLDEPSAVLADAELHGLFRVMRRLAERGVAFVYVSHRLGEVFRITDRVTVMKDGRVVGGGPTADLTTDALIRMMVGRDLVAAAARPARPATHAPQMALRISGLERSGVLHGIDLEVREGEILGVAGLAGAGRTELLRAIHGADPIDGGTVEVFGSPVRIASPRQAIGLGIGLLTEDRKVDGLLMLQSVATNITIARMDLIAPHGVVDGTAERRLVDRFIERMAIRTPGPGHRVKGLSGGNQQKVILARWLHADCRILLIDEPTRGVDVGAKREIHGALMQLAERGVAIVMVSSELPEVLALSDRIMVMREGHVTGLLDRAHATEEGIMSLATRDG
jgi:ribose transport system ATP-binding protein